MPFPLKEYAGLLPRQPRVVHGPLWLPNQPAISQARCAKHNNTPLLIHTFAMSGIQPEAHSIAMANSVVVPVGTFDTSADVEMSYEGHSDRDSKRSSWLSETSFTLERELMDLTNNDLDPMSDAEGPPVSDSASLSSLGFGFGETDASTSEVTADDDSQVGDEEGEFIDDSMYAVLEPNDSVDHADCVGCRDAEKQAVESSEFHRPADIQGHIPTPCHGGIV